MKRKACLLFSALALTAVPAFSNGFYVPVQAPEATARGNAWLATADSAAAVYYNAAGLTQTESHRSHRRRLFDHAWNRSGHGFR